MTARLSRPALPAPSSQKRPRSASRSAGAPGLVFLRETRRRVEAAGWQIVNVSVQLIGNRPRMAARRAEAEDLLTATLGADTSLSATTTDGLGFTGRGEGLAAIATALVQRT